MEAGFKEDTRRSKIPNSMRTVTPFSKYLAMILFVTLPFIGFYFGVQYKEKQETKHLDSVQSTNLYIKSGNPIHKIEWKTYESAMPNLTFSYPSDYEVARREEGLASSVIEHYEISNTNDGTIDYTLTVYDTDERTLDEWVAEKTGTLFPDEMKLKLNEDINDKSVLVYEYINQTLMRTKTNVFLFKFNESIYALSTNGDVETAAEIIESIEKAYNEIQLPEKAAYTIKIDNKPRQLYIDSSDVYDLIKSKGYKIDSLKTGGDNDDMYYLLLMEDKLDAGDIIENEFYTVTIVKENTKLVPYLLNRKYCETDTDCSGNYDFCTLGAYNKYHPFHPYGCEGGSSDVAPVNITIEEGVEVFCGIGTTYDQQTVDVKSVCVENACKAVGVSYVCISF